MRHSPLRAALEWAALAAIVAAVYLCVPLVA
jgi:hypothetical protein